MSTTSDYLFDEEMFARYEAKTIFPLESLPAELRNQIYNLAMPAPCTTTSQGVERGVALEITAEGAVKIPPLTITSRQLRAETLGYFTTAIKDPNLLIHAVIRGYNFSPLHARLSAVSQKFSISESSLRERVIITHEGLPSFPEMWSHISSQLSFDSSPSPPPPTFFFPSTLDKNLKEVTPFGPISLHNPRSIFDIQTLVKIYRLFSSNTNAVNPALTFFHQSATAFKEDVEFLLNHSHASDAPLSEREFEHKVVGDGVWAARSDEGVARELFEAVYLCLVKVEALVREQKWAARRKNRDLKAELNDVLQVVYDFVAAVELLMGNGLRFGWLVDVE